MRGRKPRCLLLAAHDKPILEQIVRSRTLPWFQVQRARAVLAIADGERVQTVAFQMQCDPSTVWRLCRRYVEVGLEGVLAEVPRTGIQSRFPPLQRAQIVQLACLEPIAKGLHITHWSSHDLACEAVVEGAIPSISARTVRRILHEVDLQPHRTRYWKTAHLDAQFKQRTERILWCYAHAQRLVYSGFWAVCVDEMPNLQVLERTPSGGLSPARSSSKSLSIPATAPSMCCCF